MNVTTDKNEYSRYTPDMATVRARITGAQPSEALTVALVRADGFGDVLTVQATADTSGAVISELSLESATQADGVNYARQGRYYVEVRGASTVRSPECVVSVVTVDEFKRGYLFGMPLHAEEVLMPVNQPRAIGGVRVVYVDNGMLKGRGALAYTSGVQTLSWRGGPAEQVIGASVQTLRLLTPEEDSYIEVEVDPAGLPGVTTSENLLIDNMRLTDADLRRYLWNAYDWTQQQLQLRLEATITTTTPTPGTFYDEVADAIPLERGMSRTIQFSAAAARPLRVVRSLAGWYADQQAITLPASWITIQEKAALVELVPVSGAIGITPIAGVWGWNLAGLRSGAAVQDFWRYTVVAGLRTLDGQRYSIREAIAKKAAIDAMIDLSIGASGGRSSRQASRDGISESWSYGGQGAFGEKIGQYQQWLDKNMPRLRAYFAGLNVITL